MAPMSLGLAPAHAELSSDEINTVYGPLIQRAVTAFGSDLSYLVDMAEHATLIEYKRLLWKARVEAANNLRSKQDDPSIRPDPDDVRQAAAALLLQWGVSAPSKFSRGSRRRRTEVS